MDDELTRLVDLEYSRFRDSYIQEIDNREDQLAANLAARGGIVTNGWSIIKLHVKKIKTLYKKRIQIEKDLMLKKYGYLDVTRMEELKKTVRGIIAQEFRKLADNQRFQFMPTPVNYSKWIQEQETLLANEAHRDIEIEMGREKIRFEEEKRKLYSPEHVNSLMDIFKLRDQLNLLFKEKFGFEVLKLKQERVFIEIATPCKNEEGFDRKILVLGDLIDWMDVDNLKLRLKVELKGARSIKLLEEFLKENVGSFDPSIIQNFKDITELRNKKYPVHTEGEEIIRIMNRLGIKYPPKNWDLVWESVIKLYKESIEGLIKLMS